jgi:hypothetical protein
MGLYSGVDLHARNSCFALVVAAGGQVFTNGVSNDSEVIFRLLHPRRN